MRLAAEYDNFRRRTQKEKEALYNDAIAAVALPWLSVIDNIERALAVAGNYNTDEARKIIEGLEMILAQSRDAINSLGISEIDALSQTFDPNRMEAVMHVEDEDAGESEVLEVLKKGYEKGDRILRHAVVKVAN
jgi:molecular chaperone GrpE